MVREKATVLGGKLGFAGLGVQVTVPLVVPPALVGVPVIVPFDAKASPVGMALAVYV